MATVLAFKTLVNTQDSGLTAYFRATGCTATTIADVLPLLSKITAYEDEYIIGEIKIWDTGSESSEPNNCSMVRVMVYNDGWVVAWFDEETVSQQNTSPAYWVDDQTLDVTTGISYQDCYNGMLVEVTSSTPTDPDCPDGTIFCIRESDYTLQTIKVHEDLSSNAYHFNTGHTYDLTIRQSNGNLVWWGTLISSSLPSNLSNRLYRAIYEMWENLRYSSNATDSTDTAIAAAFLDDGGSFTDYTTEFNNATADDVQLMPATEAVDDAFYFGSENKFRGLNLNIGTAGVGNTIVWEYWDGSAWSSLTTTDATSSFTVAGTNTVTFTPQDDWTKSFVNSSEQFWIRSRVSVAAFTTQPLLTQGWVIVPDALLYSDSNLGMYSFEDTSANYCLICGLVNHKSSAATWDISKYVYNTALLTKIIYSHTANFSVYHPAQNNRFAQSHIYFNGYQLHYHSSGSSYFDTHGYILLNIGSLDVAVGSQNVCQIRNYCFGSYYSNSQTMKFASVLITS